VGSPETGKTLLARAIAARPSEPFFITISVPTLSVDVRSSRRRLAVPTCCEQRKALSLIIFIDEIDPSAVHRVPSSAGHYEREPTPKTTAGGNDGCEGNEGNHRPIEKSGDHRTPTCWTPPPGAACGPGRFRTPVGCAAGVRAREQMLLRFHSWRRVRAADDGSPRLIARGTPGVFFSCPALPISQRAGDCSPACNKRSSAKMDEFRARQGSPDGHLTALQVNDRGAISA